MEDWRRKRFLMSEFFCALNDASLTQKVTPMGDRLASLPGILRCRWLKQADERALNAMVPAEDDEDAEQCTRYYRCIPVAAESIADQEGALERCGR